MAHRIEVTTQDHLPDPRGAALIANAHEELGIDIDRARVVDVYSIDLDLKEVDLARVRDELLTDPVAEKSSVGKPLLEDWDYWIEVGFRPGVTDNVGGTASEGIADLLNLPSTSQRTVFVATGYAIQDDRLSKDQVEKIAHGMLANDLIEEASVYSKDQFPGDEGFPIRIPKVHLPETPPVETYNLDVSDAELESLSKKNTWALTLAEMQSIRDHFQSAEVQATRKELGLPEQPTDVELEVLAQTWSEHCKHKIFASNCIYREGDGEPRRIQNLFKTTIKKTTEELAKKKDWLVSVFHDNAGAIRFTEDYHLTIKVETHNSPSALDPYGGALTGIVGVNRDPLGTGMGCRLIFNTDVFCFGLPHEERELPPPLLHPRRILRGVHRGVMDGANTSGIPDVNGAILFDRRFTGKPLVFCGTGGLLPAKVGDMPGESKEVKPGDRIVMVGGRIGKDGIHGATFSSEVLHEDSPATAVQIGDPITQRKVMDFLLEARDKGLYRSLTDNGAGGLSSSVGEMATLSGGAEMHLDRAPLKYDGLAPWEIFLSEAQERMTVVVPPEKIDDFLALAKKRSAEATDLGEFTDSGSLRVFYDGKPIGNLDLEFLHEGWPVMELPAVWEPPAAKSASIPEGDHLGNRIKSVLSRLNVCSKEPFVRMYDHEVQGGSTVKPFQGVENDGPGDAAIVRPLLNSPSGVAVSCGIVPRYSDLDAKAMAENAVDEALRNLLAVGAPLDEVAALDNFCWPDPVPSVTNPDAEYKMAQLVRACEGLQRICLAYEMPLVSGKDSMKNDSRIGNEKISIPPTLLVTAVAVMPDVSKGVTMDFKEPGDIVYVLGPTRAELGCSEYLAEFDQLGDSVPTVRPEEAWPLYQALAKATDQRLVRSCHDLSDGGLAVSLAESAFAGGLGAEVDLSLVALGEPMDRDDYILFSESPSRFVLTISPKDQTDFELLFEGLPIAPVGRVSQDKKLRIKGLSGDMIVEEAIGDLKEAWQRPFKNY
ncbi:MAG: phosphoribosylformylglycinamidine synthase [Candidatus Omnitrophica bacterium]|nr:phosphoribosylformylglycinamidine synthase [Candidatus Omnitrophota bacterium]